MPRGYGKAKKNPFAALPMEFKDAIVGMNKEEIHNRIADVALAEEEMQKAKQSDQDLSEKKEALKYANEPYRDGTKMNRLKIQFCLQVLGDKGVL